MPGNKICDGKNDCDDGGDERFCKKLSDKQVDSSVSASLEVFRSSSALPGDIYGKGI